MDCIECRANNPDSNRFCGQCGAELGRSLAETVRKHGFRDRTATEMEIAASVVDLLMKWAKWLASAAAVIIALFGLFLGKTYLDTRTALEAGRTGIAKSYLEVRTTVQEGKAEIETAVRRGKKDIDVIEEATTGLKQQVSQLQSDIGRYRQVSSSIGKLAEELKAVQGQVVDLGKRELKADKLTATGPGPSTMTMKTVGCPPFASIAKDGIVAYCTQGTPPYLYLSQLTSAALRAVSSLSPAGFQDLSNAPKPNCAIANRGTFYVEKGTGRTADKPFLCVKKSDNEYEWIQLGMIP